MNKVNGISLKRISYDALQKLLFTRWLKPNQNQIISSTTNFSSISDTVELTAAYNCLVLLLVNSRGEKWWGAHFADVILQRVSFNSFITNIKQQIANNGKDYKLYLFGLAVGINFSAERTKNKVIKVIKELGITDYEDLTGIAFGGGIVDFNTKELIYSYNV